MNSEINELVLQLKNHTELITERELMLLIYHYHWNWEIPKQYEKIISIIDKLKSMKNYYLEILKEV